MRLTLTLTEERMKLGDRYTPGRKPERETYDRVKVEGVEAEAAILAATLRGIADNIDPAMRYLQPVAAEMAVES